MFISYRHDASDAAYVNTLTVFLTAAGLFVWFDKEMISGDQWHKVIRQSPQQRSADTGSRRLPA